MNKEDSGKQEEGTVAFNELGRKPSLTLRADCDTTRRQRNQRRMIRREAEAEFTRATANRLFAEGKL